MSDPRIRDLLERALDYRGFVTLRRHDGTDLVGYVYDRGPRHVEVFDEQVAQRVRLDIDDIVDVALTGDDSAAKAQQIWERRHGMLEPHDTPAWGEWEDRPTLIVVALARELQGIARALGAQARGATALGRLGEYRALGIAIGTGGGAAHVIAEHHPRLVISCGFSGALDPALRPGDVVLASSVCDEDGRTIAVAEADRLIARRALLGPAEGEILCATRVAATALEKRALARPGRLAIDLETWAIATAAREAGIPWLAVRVILDPLDRELPAFVRDTRANYTPAAVRHALRGPRAALDLARLARDARIASYSLERAVRRIAPVVARLTAKERVREPASPATESVAAPVDASRTIERSRGWFRTHQFEEGYWWAELESNATMDAEYILMTHVLGERDDEIWRGVAADIRSYQRDDGSWALYAGAPGDLSTTIECYFALLLAGDAGPHLDRAKHFITARGGIARARVFTKIWLALCGEWSWDDLPAMPLEIVLLPPRAPLSIYRFSSWARATLVPLLVLMDDRPVRPVPASASLAELRISGPVRPKARDAIDRAFYAIDSMLRGYRRLPWHPLLDRARQVAEQWIVAHQEADGSWGGIQPPWVYSLMALHAIGYGSDHPVIRTGVDGMHQHWMVRHGDGRLRLQACLSPVWDSALALLAVLEAGGDRSEREVRKAARWLLDKEVRVAGDWRVSVPDVEPSGWSFEFDNQLYPDIDDTAVVLLGLHHAGALDDATRRRALAWIFAMQSENGGWAAFDKDNTARLPAMIPFADFGEMIDPPSADVTAHVVEMLGVLGVEREHPAIAKALDYLYAEQEPEGSWFGRWGVNHIYGTGAVLPALAAIGEPMDSACVRRAVRWLVDRQNDDGGFGEGCESYVVAKARGRGPSTPSQTAWALLALVAAGRAGSPAARRAAAYLVDTQRDDGSWDETAYTGTGFPGYAVGEQRGARTRQGRELSAAFLLRYHLYRNCFPLLALGRYRAAIGGKG